MARHESNTIPKCADDTSVVGLITNNNETAAREEVRDLAGWCQNNNLSLNVTKTKEMIVDYRKRRTEHAPIHIGGAVVEHVESFKFLGVHITNKLTWSKHTMTVVKQTQQKLFPLRKLKIFAWVLRSSKSYIAAPLRVSWGHDLMVVLCVDLS